MSLITSVIQFIIIIVPLCVAMYFIDIMIHARSVIGYRHDYTDTSLENKIADLCSSYKYALKYKKGYIGDRKYVAIVREGLKEYKWIGLLFLISIFLARISLNLYYFMDYREEMFHKTIPYALVFAIIYSIIRFLKPSFQPQRNDKKVDIVTKTGYILKDLFLSFATFEYIVVIFMFFNAPIYFFSLEYFFELSFYFFIVTLTFLFKSFTRKGLLHRQFIRCEDDVKYGDYPDNDFKEVSFVDISIAEQAPSYYSEEIDSNDNSKNLLS